VISFEKLLTSNMQAAAMFMGFDDNEEVISKGSES
jgi:hypothetical protein